MSGKTVYFIKIRKCFIEPKCLIEQKLTQIDWLVVAVLFYCILLYYLLNYAHECLENSYSDDNFTNLKKNSKNPLSKKSKFEHFKCIKKKSVWSGIQKYFLFYFFAVFCLIQLLLSIWLDFGLNYYVFLLFILCELIG